MVVAQQLYEGLRLGDQGSVGLITYMRTDSTSLTADAVTEARSYISQRFGPEYLPKDRRAYRTKTKGAQEAHEAIRPTSPQRTPEHVKAHLNRDQLRLYDLIWRRMVACQMADAISDATSVDVEASTPGVDAAFIFRATGNQSKFPGFIALYMEGQDETPEASDEEDGALPRLVVDDALAFLGQESKQHFTQPPPRFTEATLVKLLEAQGIGRPSTYAPILSTLVDRNYVLKEQNRLKPTILGTKVSELLTEFFPEIMDVTFTASMEGKLDDIAQGERPWIPMLQAFYAPFKKTLEAAEENMPRVRVEEPTDEICDLCNSPMVIKTGRFGRFIACSTFPECRNTKPILKHTGAICPKCGGDLVERRSRGKGRTFYGCAKYPACDFSVVQKPLPDPCPECDGLMVAKGRDRVACTICAWQGEPSQQEPVTTEV
jgi:DNA topoisomerase-1